jgi:hypothetical protein
MGKGDYNGGSTIINTGHISKKKMSEGQERHANWVRKQLLSETPKEPPISKRQKNRNRKKSVLGKHT